MALNVVEKEFWYFVLFTLNLSTPNLLGSQLFWQIGFLNDFESQKKRVEKRWFKVYHSTFPALHQVDHHLVERVKWITTKRVMYCSTLLSACSMCDCKCFPVTGE